MGGKDEVDGSPVGMGPGGGRGGGSEAAAWDTPPDATAEADGEEAENGCGAPSSRFPPFTAAAAKEPFAAAVADPGWDAAAAEALPPGGGRMTALAAAV